MFACCAVLSYTYKYEIYCFLECATHIESILFANVKFGFLQ